MLHSVSLDGTWKLRHSDGVRGLPRFAEREYLDPARYIDAAVPGEVHLDLLKAGMIDDPYVDRNVLKARWVEEQIWSYRREFDAPAEALAEGARAWMVFDQLDYAATVFLNGKQIGAHSNFFYPCRIDVTGALKEAGNILAVHLDSGLYHVANKSVEGFGPNIQIGLHKRPWLRKPQCQFGWDWSPRLINVGISGNVRLEYTSASVRVDQFVPLATLSADFKLGSVRGKWFVDNLLPTEQRAQLSIELLGTTSRQTQEVTLKPGLHPVEATIELANPRLWNPVGHGQPNRYPVKIALHLDGKLIAEKTADIGFRHVRVNQDPHPDGGTFYIIEINGKKIFMKGANFVPADMIFAKLDQSRYQTLVDRALEANFNLLRVWGGGLYESDDFYELCDANGILVWQEFIYACSRYPMTDQNFFDDAKREAVYQIRRLASHPSLIVWCGNNENEQGNWHWGYDKGTVYPDYAFFHLTLPRLMAAEDPTRFYQPSSPFSLGVMDPLRDDTGDQHPWTVGFQDVDFYKYRKMICRFPNEGGILGPTSLPTMLACLPKADQYVQSFAWQIHDNAINGWEEPSPADNLTQFWLGKNARDMSIEEFTYYGGLIQGEGLKEYIENFRRRMFSSAAAVFWMYNDTWPATRSWTIVDYYCRRTPSFMPVKRAMAPIHVVIADEGEQTTVFGINETDAPVAAQLRFGVMNLAGGYQLDQHAEVTLAPNASTPLQHFPRSKWTQHNASAAFAILTQGGKPIARNRLLLEKFKDIHWPTPNVTIRMGGGQAIFQSPTFAWGVCLDLNGETPLADNFFDVYPGIDYAIPWNSPEKPKIMRVGNLQSPPAQ